MLKKLLYLAMATTLLSGTSVPEEENLDKLVSTQTVSERTVQNTEQDYSILLEEIKNKQTELSQKYAKAKTKQGEKAILEESRNFIFHTVTEKIIPPWFGTPWEFYGNTEIPKKGAIACGYFVNTILQHAGFNLDRIALSKQISEYNIKSLTGEKNITRFRNKPLEYFIRKTKEKGEGLYVIGLDFHTGFLVSDGSNLEFCHSSYLDPYNSVVCEKAEDSLPIIHSRYRVVGKILDYKLMEKWLKNEFIKTVKK